MYYARTALWVAMAALLGACGPDQPPAEAPTTETGLGPGRVATVNGEAIPESLFRYYALNTLQKNADNLTAAEREALLEELIQFKILEQAAREAGLPRERTIAVELELQRIRMLANAVATRHLERNPATAAELRAAYEEHLPQLTARQYKARHILLPSESEAAAVIAELEDGADFIALERAHSFGPNNEEGGDLGWFSLDETVGAFADAVRGMEVGSYSAQPVRTQFGWHVILLEDTRDPEAPAMDAVRDQLEAIVERRKLEAHLEELRERAEVEVGGG
jgi:peptidyl-prolyl cis-trans isomerase C